MKIINLNGMVGYELHPLDSHETFNHIQDMKEYIPVTNEKDKEFHFSYIKPGHRKNGKQLQSDDDVHEMYSRFKKVNITMDRTFGYYCHKETCDDNSWSKSMIQVNARALSQPESSTFRGS